MIDMDYAFGVASMIVDYISGITVKIGGQSVSMWSIILAYLLINALSIVIWHNHGAGGDN